MEPITPTINMVVYLLANAQGSDGKSKKAHYLGGHGYTYDLTQEGKKQLAKDVPTSTGYYTGNKQKANTVVITQNIVSLTVPGAKSRLDALLKGLNTILAEFVSKPEYKNLCIVTPHKELELAVKTKIDQLDKNFKLGKETLSDKEREDLLQIIANVYILNKDPERKIIFDFAGSAEGGMGNRMAHKQLELAEVETVWAHMHKIHLSIVSRKEYENPESDFNKMISATRWYFQTGEREAFYEKQFGYRVYGFGKVEPDKNYYGKLTPDVTYSKLYTLEPITLLDKLFEFTVSKIKNPDGYLSAGDLNGLTSKDVARLVDTMPAVPKNTDLVSPITKGNGKPILIELIRPTMMSYRIREFLDIMDMQLKAFLEKDENNKYGYCQFYDMTDQVYTKEENGKGVVKLKLHPDFNQLKTTFKVTVAHPQAVKPVTLMLSIGYDIPERNSFNSVTDPDVKVWVITDTRNAAGIRYSTLVHTKDFIYIHTSAAANLHVLSLAELGKK